MPASVPPHQALPVHVDAKRAHMDAESAAELNKLLEPNELRTFVEQHPEFANRAILCLGCLWSHSLLESRQTTPLNPGPRVVVKPRHSGIGPRVSAYLGIVGVIQRSRRLGGATGGSRHTAGPSHTAGDNESSSGYSASSVVRKAQTMAPEVANLNGPKKPEFNND